MISLEEAKAKIDEAVMPLSSRPVVLSKALGCVLSEDIVSPTNVPPFRSSSMDGIAVRRSDLQGDGPWRLKLLGSVMAGQLAPRALPTGNAVKVMTGAPIPDDADMVIPIEEVTIDRDYVSIAHFPSEDFVRPVGDDMKKGQRVYARGEILRPIDIGVLASLGLAKVNVIPYPRVAVFSTGQEITLPGRRLKPGHIYDGNASLLQALFARDGLTVGLGRNVIPDDSVGIDELLNECQGKYDLVVTTGGVSAGELDLLPQRVMALGGEVVFHKVAIKPGKPALLARMQSYWLVGLPGNPVGALVGYHLYVRRTVGLLMGKPYRPKSAEVPLGCDLEVQSDRLNLIGTRLEESDNGLVAFPSVSQKSHRLFSVKGIDGFIFVAPGKHLLTRGTSIDFEWL